MAVVVNPRWRWLTVWSGHASAARPCDCPTWNLLGRTGQDLILAGFMQRAWWFYRVQLKLLVHGTHVMVHALVVLRPGEGRARQVMSELCRWADCARVTLELTPSDHWGSDVERLRRLYESFGFEPNTEPAQAFVLQGDLIRYPMKRARTWNPLSSLATHSNDGEQPNQVRAALSLLPWSSANDQGAPAE